MSFELKPTTNNPFPIEFKKELEILEVTTISQYNNNNYPIPFKKEPINDDNNNNNNNNERANKLELENKTLQIYDK